MFILGWFFPWRLTCLPGVLLPLLPPLLVAFLPETPAWLVAQGRRQEAVDNLAKLRGLSREGVEEELKALEVVVKAEKDRTDRDWRETLTRLLDRKYKKN